MVDSAKVDRLAIMFKVPGAQGSVTTTKQAYPTGQYAGPKKKKCRHRFLAARTNEIIVNKLGTLFCLVPVCFFDE